MVHKTADALVFSRSLATGQLQLLLVQRKYPPFAQDWAFPGGFLQEGEEPLAGCLRELAEETGLQLSADLARPLTVRDKYRRDSRGPTTSWPFYFLVEDLTIFETMSADDDAQNLGLFPLEQIPPLAFDHGAMLNEALGKFFGLLATDEIGDVGGMLPSMLAGPTVQWPLASITLYGGSFNPWHLGHEACINQYQAVSNIPLVVIPDHNPWKEHFVDQCFFQKLRQLVPLVVRPQVYLYSGFLGKEQGNPTISWIGQVRAMKKYLLMGDDSFCSLLDWQDAKMLLAQLTGIFVVPRRADPELFGKQREKILQIAPHLAIMRPGNHAYEGLSSGRLREQK